MNWPAGIGISEYDTNNAKYDVDEKDAADGVVSDDGVVIDDDNLRPPWPSVTNSWSLTSPSMACHWERSPSSTVVSWTSRSGRRKWGSWGAAACPACN